MALPTTGTVLELSGLTLRNYSARALTLEVGLIDAGQLAYDVNGTLRDLTMEQFRKYTFALSCTDVDVPIFEDVWKGAPVTLTILPYSGMAEDVEDAQQTFSCLVSGWTTSNDEWGRMTGWTLNLTQI
jgi:hypothetical protein